VKEVKGMEFMLAGVVIALGFVAMAIFRSTSGAQNVNRES
jgi:hypothetical protein